MSIVGKGSVFYTDRRDRVAAALSLAITQTSVADTSRPGPPGCPLTADELRYLAEIALDAADEDRSQP